VADERLRLLARAAQDDPSRSAELLVARMRRGDVTAERVELASFVGDTVARSVLGFAPPAETWFRSDHELAVFVECLAKRGAEPLVRAACAAAWPALRVYDQFDVVSPFQASRAIEAAETWLGCPCESHAREAERLGPGTLGPRLRWVTSIGQAVAAFDQARRTPTIANVLSNVAADFASEAIVASAAVVGGSAGVAGGEARTRDAIRSSLTAWVLSSERTS
jgi:hypothetical protein